MSLPLLKRMHGAATAAVLAALLCTSVPGIAAPFAYITNQGSNDVSVIDTRRLEVIATLRVGKAPYGAALAHDGALLYVSNQHDDSVSVVDADRLETVRTLPGFGYPEGVAAHADRVYVVNWMDDDVSVLDAASGRLLARIATGKNSRGFGAFIGAPLAP